MKKINLKYWLGAIVMALMLLGCEAIDPAPLPNPQSPPEVVAVVPEAPGATPVTALAITIPDGEDTNLEKEETLQLTAVFTPDDATNKNVGWVSSNTTIATVSSAGLVTAIDGGTATITVFSKAVPSVRTTQTITVITHVTGVSLSQETMGIFVGGSSGLTANIVPGNATDKGVSWESSNPAVATVSGEGLSVLINGRATGTATITATTTEGGYRTTASVTVTEPATFNPAGTHSLIVRNLKESALADGTTPNNPALITWTGSNYTGSFTVTNNEAAAMGDSGAGKPTASTLVYLNTPIKGSYTFKAKLSFDGSNTGGGLFFGTFSNPTPAAVAFDGFFHLVGIRNTNGGAVRRFFATKGGGIRSERFTGDPGMPKATEYIYEISWDASTRAYTVKITKTDGTVYSETIPAGDGNDNVHSLLTNANGWYFPGFFVSRTTATISEVSISVP